jgi:hypothetical protein
MTGHSTTYSIQFTRSRPYKKDDNAHEASRLRDSGKAVT